MDRTGYILALDTANEVVSLGLGRLQAPDRRVEHLASRTVPAHRASNTLLLPQALELLRGAGVRIGQLACVAVGRGPGSFTGVRIALATAKGLASALDVPLVGVSTLDAVAWGLHDAGLRGRVLVAADAMRHEVYPVRFELSEDGVTRLCPDSVAKVEACIESLGGAAPEAAAPFDLVAGDALAKYGEQFAALGTAAPRELWEASGRGLLLAVQAAWRAGGCDPFDALLHDPAVLLPVYTRLSDAEENERARLASTAPRNLSCGVQGGNHRVQLRPLDLAHVPQVALLEQRLMKSDAWNEHLLADDLPRRDRIWWAAFDGDQLAGYAGGWVAFGQLTVLKVAVDQAFQRQGIAQQLLSRLADDARNLGAAEATLEVRAGNAPALALYERLGLQRVGTRPGYYRDGEDAVIMTGPIDGLRAPLLGAGGAEAEADADPAAPSPASVQVAGMRLHVGETSGDETSGAAGTAAFPVASAPDTPSPDAFAPLILAIESSCDETAAAVIDGQGRIVADVVASQIDFHARFGGVVPEIASRKHTEAICGVCQVCLEQAARALGLPRLRWRDLSAVAATYAPGLVGALVVGVAFAKGAAAAAGIPFIRVNHLEGHLYANKLAAPDVAPPLVASLVSGGNTMLVHVRDWGSYQVLGSTIDDAVGEAFDKVAKALDLGYPGGPHISRLAAQGNPKAIAFPRAMLHSGDLRFSLSGLKTAVTSYIAAERAAGRALNVPDICASFQAAVVDVQVAKARTALQQTGARTLAVGGGVAANPALREAYQRMCDHDGVRLVVPPLAACGDNAAMIALVAAKRFADGAFADLDADVAAHADLEEPY